MTSFVPKGQQDLVVKNSTMAEVFEEKVTPGGSHEEVSQGDESMHTVESAGIADRTLLSQSGKRETSHAA